MHDPLIQIPNYAIEGTCRQSKRVEGLHFMYKRIWCIKIRNDLSSNNPDIDSCFIELINTGKAPYVLCNNFTESFNTSLSLISNEKSAILWETIISTY